VIGVARRLVDAGLRPEEAGAKARLFDRTLDALRAMSDSTRRETHGLFVPGRIEMLGKHTDYAGGRSLLCTVERGIVFAASPRDDAVVRIVRATDGGHESFDADPNLDVERAGWRRYAAVVVRRLARDFGSEKIGADIAFDADLPIAAGLSSSSALVVGLGLILSRLGGLESTGPWRREIATTEDLAGYLSAVENGRPFGTLGGGGGVGTRGGSEDHTSMLCCRPGSLSQYAFVPVRHERTVTLPDAWTFVVATSGVVAEKAGGALEEYNRAERVTARLLELWNARTRRGDRSLGEAAASDASARAILREIARSSRDEELPADLLVARLDQFLDETFEIIPGVVSLFADGRVDAIGPLVARSQHGAERGLRNQIPETVALVRSALELGAVAASAFGAGFGGSVWALVPSDVAMRFRDEWIGSYRSARPSRAEHAMAFATRPGPPVVELD